MSRNALTVAVFKGVVWVAEFLFWLRCDRAGEWVIGWVV